MPVWLIPQGGHVFPHPLTADETGILAVGGDLAPKTLLVAYRFGIFPWFSGDEPLLWWFPNPRMVLMPDAIRISKSMRPYFNQEKFSVSFDRAFEQVIRKCGKAERPNQNGGTWIDDRMVAAYVALHELGYAHSVEVWEDGRLVGGLYGVALGRIFFGESMFSEVSNSSKFALIVLAKFLRQKGFTCIDCQQETDHLRKMGAEVVSAAQFYESIRSNLLVPSLRGAWSDLWNSELPGRQSGS